MKNGERIQRLTFAGLWTALTTMLVWLSVTVPAFSFTLPLFLPLISAIVIIKTDSWTFGLYALATTLLGLIWSSHIDAVLFYVWPSLGMGFILGFGLQHRWTTFGLLLISSIVQTAISAILYVIIEAIYGVSVYRLLFELFGFIYDGNVIDIAMLLTYAVSIAQVLLTAWLWLGERSTLRLPASGEDIHPERWQFLSLMLTMLLVVSFAFSTIWNALLFGPTLWINLYLILRQPPKHFAKRKWIYLTFIVGLPIVFAWLNSAFSNDSILLLLPVFLLPEILLQMVEEWLRSRKNGLI